MTAPRLNFVHCPDNAGGHRMAYWQWGDASSAHVVLCVHGLSRQGRDFDTLAAALCARAEQKAGSLRVVCPDVVGRGQSDWLADPTAYQIPTYTADMLALLAQLERQAPISALDWVGTSMGGLIGLVVCSQACLPVPRCRPPHGLSEPALLSVRRLVLNDVGPTLQWQAVARIGSYLGQGGPFKTLQQAADALWLISSGFGPHTPAQWLALSRPMVKPLEPSDAESGECRLHYDPAIAVPFKQATEASTAQGDSVLWQLYDRVTARTLVLRGALSDLLSAPTMRAMTLRGPAAQWVEFPGVGHAPTLVADDQVQAVQAFLLDSIN